MRERSGSRGSAQARRVGDSRRALVVAPPARERSQLVTWVREAGYEVEAAGTFNAGRAALAQSTPDLLIVDLHLGEFNGLQLASRVRQQRSPCHVILTSSVADLEAAAEARREGVLWAPKPLVEADFRELLRRLRLNC